MVRTHRGMSAREDGPTDYEDNNDNNLENMPCTVACILKVPINVTTCILLPWFAFNLMRPLAPPSLVAAHDAVSQLCWLALMSVAVVLCGCKESHSSSSLTVDCVQLNVLNSFLSNSSSNPVRSPYSSSLSHSYLFPSLRTHRGQQGTRRNRERPALAATF